DNLEEDAVVLDALKPVNPRDDEVTPTGRVADKLASQRILVALDSWPRNSRYPLGHFVRALGPIGDKDAENEVILLEHDVPHARFSEAVLACLPPSDWTIPKEASLCIFIVILLEHDVPHARFSEAVLAPNTPLDKEAQSRSTTVYLVDRRIDMVPAIDTTTRQDDVAQSLRTLNALAKKLKRRRMDNGALLLASPEIRF
ncbi:Exosome complex exonuclease RRP44, partial [Operophtera brumata]